ncbi:hypothetical protein PRJ_3520 [Pseudomonas sp. XWY-1]|nr:hypothetical protein PRJ_3520 [Pseudomonas sp. XWY-1]
MAREQGVAAAGYPVPRLPVSRRTGSQCRVSGIRAHSLAGERRRSCR